MFDVVTFSQKESKKCQTEKESDSVKILPKKMNKMSEVNAQNSIVVWTTNAEQGIVK